MSTDSVYYNRYSDNLAFTATTVTVSPGTIESGYSAEWVRDNSAAKPLRLSTKQGAVVFSWSSPVSVAIIALLHCNYAEGTTVYVQGNATNSWGSPSFSTTITVPAWKKGRFPPQPWKDLRALSGWGSYAYWRVATTADNAVNLTLGEIWLGSTVRTLGAALEEKPSFERTQVERTTAYRRLRIPLGTTRRSLEGTVPKTSNTVRDDIRDWILDSDGRATLVVPKSSDATDAWHALLPTFQEFEQFDRGITDWKFALEEDGRGLEPTPSPLP